MTNSTANMGYEQYLVTLMKAIKPVLVKSVKCQKLTKRDQTLQDFVNSFLEINQAIDALKLSIRLAESAQPRLHSLDRTTYLRYHINAFLNELYILKERLKAHHSLALVIFRPRLNVKEKKIFKRAMSLWLKENLSNSIQVRNYHVHESRYTNELINYAEILSIPKLSETELTNAVELVEKLSKYKWLNEAKSYLSNLDCVLDTYCDVIYSGCFPKGKIVIPKKSAMRNTR